MFGAVVLRILQYFWDFCPKIPYQTYAIGTTIYTHVRIFRIITCAGWGPSRGEFPQSSPQNGPTKRIEPYRYRAERLGGLGVPLAADASGCKFLSWSP